MKNAKNKYNWSELSNLPRAEAILQACETLESQGVAISRGKVRDIIGGGSDRDIQPVLNLYHAQKELLSECGHTPAILVSVIAKVVDGELKKINAEFVERQEAERQLFVRSYEELSQKLSELELINNALSEGQDQNKQQLESLFSEIDDKNKEIQHFKDRLNETENRLREKIIINEKLSDRIRDKDESISGLERQYEKSMEMAKKELLSQREELLQAHDAETARLMTVQGNERGEWQKNERKLNKMIAGLNQSLRELQDMIEDKNRQVVKHVQALDTKEKEIIELRKKVKKNSDLEAEINGLDEQVRRLKEENQVLTIRLQDIQDVNEQIMSLKEQIINLKSNKNE